MKQNMQVLCMGLVPLLLAAGCRSSSRTVAEEEGLELFYTSPAPEDYAGWEQFSLPIGNGRLGASISGGTARERIRLNEKTLWSGGPSASRPEYQGGNLTEKGKNGATLKEIQALFARGDYEAAGRLCDELTGLSDDAGIAGYGYYLSYGSLIFDFDGDGDALNYRRSLDLKTGIAKESYERAGVRYTKEHFASWPDEVLVTRISMEGGSLSLTVSAEADTEMGGGPGKPPEAAYGRDWQRQIRADSILIDGSLRDNGLCFSSATRLITDGRLIQKEDGLRVEGARELVALTAISTDYKNEYPRYRTGESSDMLSERVKNTAARAASRSYAGLRQRHIEDYGALFSRLHLDLGQGLSTRPTDELLRAYKDGSADEAERRELEVLLFQYGRYLTIASSRSASDGSGLPSNLQGLWVGANNSAWHSDYHLNVNLQMNYWPVYTANLAECAFPLLYYVDSLREPGRVTAKIYAGIESTESQPENGFMAHTQNNPYGWTCPGWSFDWGWSPAAVPWLLLNCWEHYQYTGDKEILKDLIYPMMREACVLYDQLLVEDGSGRLVSSPSFSPEHGPRTAGNTYEHTLISLLYRNTIEAAEILGVDESLRARWEKNRAGLRGPLEIGEDGQIKEWFEETKLNSLGEGFEHRHLSHLLGLFPGDLITENDEALFKAARVSLENRTDESTGWGMGQRINSWARLKDGDRAYKLITDLFARGILPNLWDTHPPFQIDGNFGYTSGIAEMLLQSHAGAVEILPALPAVWSTGSVRGIRARGGFEADIDWHEGRADRVRLISHNGNEARIRGMEGARVTDSRGRTVDVQTEALGTLSFQTRRGGVYLIERPSEPAR